MKYIKRCEYCGKIFVATRINARFCCPTCCRAWDRQRQKLRTAQKRIENKSTILNRPFTVDTPFLCQKWHKEGMTVKELATLLERSVENVEEALRVELAPGELEAIEKYFIPRR